MSKKKVSKFLAYKDQFIDGLMENGCLAKDALELWESLEDFSKYAFNKSHAAAYAILAYQTAWLKYHYPTEFMCSFLNHTDVKEIPSKLYECKELGISILPPDINRSSVNFEDYQNNILFGLGAVKGIKKWAKPIIEERSQHGKYQSFQDFLLRAHKNKGATGNWSRPGLLIISAKTIGLRCWNKWSRLFCIENGSKKKKACYKNWTRSWKKLRKTNSQNYANKSGKQSNFLNKQKRHLKNFRCQTKLITNWKAWLLKRRYWETIFPVTL